MIQIHPATSKSGSDRCPDSALCLLLGADADHGSPSTHYDDRQNKQQRRDGDDACLRTEDSCGAILGQPGRLEIGDREATPDSPGIQYGCHCCRVVGILFERVR